ncbi:MAG: DUF817 family protein [Gemmatimonadaceae bacterium]|nr:DUF817 family protein [Caulobacter sp.]
MAATRPWASKRGVIAAPPSSAVVSAAAGKIWEVMGRLMAPPRRASKRGSRNGSRRWSPGSGGGPSARGSWAGRTSFCCLASSRPGPACSAPVVGPDRRHGAPSTGLDHLAGAWADPSQRDGWHRVSIGKLGAWYLLMLLSYVLVTAVHPPRKA